MALGVNATRTVFVRVVAPAGALPADPANVTTLTTTYNAGAASASATDTTSVSGPWCSRRTTSRSTARRRRRIRREATRPRRSRRAPRRSRAVHRLPDTGDEYAAVNLTLVVVTDAIPAIPGTARRAARGRRARATDVGTIAAPADGATGTVAASARDAAARPDRGGDVLREDRPVTVRALAVRHASRWVAFALALALPRSGPRWARRPRARSSRTRRRPPRSVGVTPVGASSNVVQLTTAGAGEAARRRSSKAPPAIAPGGTAYFPHTLTNSGGGGRHVRAVDGEPGGPVRPRAPSRSCPMRTATASPTPRCPSRRRDAARPAGCSGSSWARSRRRTRRRSPSTASR